MALKYWWVSYKGWNESGLTGIKINCNPNSGIRMKAALSAFFTPSGAGFGELGLRIVRITRKMSTRKTVINNDY